MRIATDLHDDVGAGLSQIAILSEVARLGAAVEHGREEPLVRIGSIARELVDSMSDLVWSISPRKDRLHDLTGRMREVASDLLIPRNIRFELVPLRGERQYQAQPGAPPPGLSDLQGVHPQRCPPLRLDGSQD